MYSRLGGDIKKGGLNCVTDMRLLVSMQKYNTHTHVEKGGPTYALSTSQIKDGEMTCGHGMAIFKSFI